MDTSSVPARHTKRQKLISGDEAARASTLKDDQSRTQQGGESEESREQRLMVAIEKKGKEGWGLLDMIFMIKEGDPVMLVAYRDVSDIARDPKKDSPAPWFNPETHEVIVFCLIPLLVAPGEDMTTFESVAEFAEDPNAQRCFGVFDVSRIVTNLTPEEFGADTVTDRTLRDFVKTKRFEELNADGSMRVYPNITQAATLYKTGESMFYVADRGIPLLRSICPEGKVTMDAVRNHIKYRSLVSFSKVKDAFYSHYFSAKDRSKLSVDRVRTALERINVALNVGPKEGPNEVLARLANILTSPVHFPFMRIESLDDLAQSKVIPPAQRNKAGLDATVGSMTYLLASLCVIPSIRETFVGLVESMHSLSNERETSRKTRRGGKGKSRRSGTKKKKGRGKTNDSIDDFQLADNVVRLFQQIFSKASNAPPAAFKAVFGVTRDEINTALQAAADGKDTSDVIDPEAARWVVHTHVKHALETKGEEAMKEMEKHPVNFVRPVEVQRASRKVNPVGDRSNEINLRRRTFALANERAFIVETVDAATEEGAQVLEEILDSAALDGLSPRAAAHRGMLAALDILLQEAKIAPLVAGKLRAKIAKAEPLPPISASLYDISAARDLLKPGIVVGKLGPDVQRPPSPSIVPIPIEAVHNMDIPNASVGNVMMDTSVPQPVPADPSTSGYDSPGFGMGSPHLDSLPIPNGWNSSMTYAASSSGPSSNLLSSGSWNGGVSDAEFLERTHDAMRRPSLPHSDLCNFSLFSS